MKNILKKIKHVYRQVLQSIAFYPVLISFIFFLAAGTALGVDSSVLADTVEEELPYLFIQDYETARSILSTLLGGILSLTVFSFTMVMVVLNQASSNFSPRLLPGLISNKKHQIILGIYIGTLLFCTIILISLGAAGVDKSALGFSTMLAALFGLLCIGLFVYFIHNISGAIQIHNIIDRIYERCDHYLETQLKHEPDEKVALQYIDTEDWQTFSTDKTGYFRGFDVDLMLNSLKDKEMQIVVLPYMNQHIWKGSPTLKCKGDISEKEKNNLIFCLNISSDRHEEDEGIGGLIKLMEIAVKAMSPGINDPGTAIDVLTKLGVLLSKFLQLPSLTSTPFKGQELILVKNNIDAEELMRVIIQPIRLYAKKDGSVMYELIKALQYISKTANISSAKIQVIHQEMNAARSDLEKNIDNERDKQRILSLFEDI
ncbi:DUF2254 domain-containing protein [Pareuzebyella sediminis]|uniref:DUF2254 domain-containing protein n=1 Tax=Pareuzebyella sediminis TaxID=2607998 RepID=UPI0011ECF2A5|nr:DUF2254 domain-containing protein [Pareuzebyella sediminis]